MELHEKLGWFLLGCVIGGIVGYVVRLIQDVKEELDEVKEEVHEVDELVKKHQNLHRDESGLVRYPILMDVVLLLVVSITVYAAFSSQKASNELADTQEQLTQTQDRIAQLTSCNQTYLLSTIAALNERTTYTRRQVEANVELQKNQAEFLSILLVDPPAPSLDQREALRMYFSTLTNFVVVSERADEKVEQNPYPTEAEVSACFNSK